MTNVGIGHPVRRFVFACESPGITSLVADKTRHAIQFITLTWNKVGVRHAVPLPHQVDLDLHQYLGACASGTHRHRPLAGSEPLARTGIAALHRHPTARSIRHQCSHPQRAMHYPQLMSTTGVSADMIAMGAVVDDWPNGSVPRQPCYHVLNDCLTRSSCTWRDVWRAAAVLPRQPCSRFGTWHTVPHPGHEIAECARADQRVGQTCLRSLPVDGYGARDSCLRTSGHGQHLPAEARMPPRRLEACATEGVCSPA